MHLVSKINNSLLVRNYIIKNMVLFFSLCLLILLNVTPAYAITYTEHDPTDFDCVKCHPSHLQNISPTKTAEILGAAQSLSTQSIETTSVVGNITLIASVGQNWFQQGIYGPNSTANDKSWGWTFFDETPSKNLITPREKVTQRNGIYALLLDSGNNTNPIKGAQVVANVTYWIYDGVSYTNHSIQVPLSEDLNLDGFYSGVFNFYGGTTYKIDPSQCDGCHLEYYLGIDTQPGYFPGNYTVTINANADGQNTSSNVNFEVTPWGCENCHGSGNQHGQSVDMDSACYLCHGINQIVHPKTDGGNPHQNTAHISIECTDCHTNRSLNSQTFSGVTFIQGGLNNALLPQYTSEQTQLNSGTHTNLACTDCHDDLTLPEPAGGYYQSNYTIVNTINNYNPTFASIQQFQDYYTINLDQSEPLNITFNWEGTSNLGFYLYPPNFNPRNRTKPMNPADGDYPYYSGSTLNKPEFFINASPLSGKWILAVYGYDLQLPGILQPPINYTINSTYPIQQKALPRIPECNNCHNSTAIGGANAKHEIPDWNPGFAHVDTNNDGTLDIQCRMCHNAMHNIIIRACQNCHTSVPPLHPIEEPEFFELNQSQCLECHGDPHEVLGSCVSCHEAISPTNLTLNLGQHALLNGTLEIEDEDCRTCHFAPFPMIQGAVNANNTYYCEDCHTSAGTGPQKSIILFEEKRHGEAACIDCHVADGTYHQENPRGSIANLTYVNRYNAGSATITNCADCHYASNLDDAPFNAPGAGEHVLDKDDGNSGACSNPGCHAAAGFASATMHNLGYADNTFQNPSISTPVLSVNNVVSGTHVTITATVSVPAYYAIVDGAQYRIENGSGEIVPWTPMFADDGNFDGSSEYVNVIINTSNTNIGDYTIQVRGMAGGKAQSDSARYYPMNGDVSGALSTMLTIAQPSGYINGTVTNGSSPIADVIVSTETGEIAVTNNFGFYSLALRPGEYNLTASKEPEYYSNSSTTIEVFSETTIVQDFILILKPTGSIRGNVTNKAG
ncbi:MAG: cytochrome c3 family protein [Methanosarcinales archaeon]|nr:cytochrome c3 family protein [Methanosarcinales archaeon]